MTIPRGFGARHDTVIPFPAKPIVSLVHTTLPEQERLLAELIDTAERLDTRIQELVADRDETRLAMARREYTATVNKAAACMFYVEELRAAAGREPSFLAQVMSAMVVPPA